MSPKVILALCASALIVNVISGQCVGNGINNVVNELTTTGLSGDGLSSGYVSSANGLGLNANGLGFGANGLRLGANGLSPANLASSCGGSFTVSSASPIAPSGISVVSENALNGPLSVSGGLPFLSAVGLEGQVPASGASGVSYNCGNGNVGIVSENVAPAANAGISCGLGAGHGGSGFGSPLAGRRFGANLGSIGNRGHGCGVGAY